MSGGPAFPVPNSANVNGQEGMTLRDYFAGQALAGFCANHDLSDWTPTEVAADVYSFADAMLAQREKESNDE